MSINSERSLALTEHFKNVTVELDYRRPRVNNFNIGDVSAPALVHTLSILHLSKLHDVSALAAVHTLTVLLM